MNVASFELCKNLPIEWNDTRDIWVVTKNETSVWRNDGQFEVNGIDVFPAPDLGFLVRKLPDKEPTRRLDIMGDTIEVSKVWWLEKKQDQWVMHYGVKPSKYYRNGQVQVFAADTPENAAAKLCIELIRHGILPKESK